MQHRTCQRITTGETALHMVGERKCNLHLPKGFGAVSPSLGFFEGAPAPFGIANENKRPVSETAMPRPMAADTCVTFGRRQLHAASIECGAINLEAKRAVDHHNSWRRP